MSRALVYSRCVHPETCPDRITRPQLHALGIHDAVKIINIDEPDASGVKG